MPKIIIFRQDLYSEIMSEPQLNVVALPAIEITGTGFTAKWLKNSVAREYFVDISTDPAFSSLTVAGALVGDVTSHAFSGLQPGTTYYYRVRATDGVKTGAWSNTISLSLPVLGIGYGLLYNWYAATDARNITSSDDWCVPDHLEFKTLFDYLGGDDIAGGKLKEIGFIYWDSLNTGATNEVGFNARGAGIRYIYEDMAVFTGIKQLLVYWNSTDIPEGGRASTIYYDVDGIATYDGTSNYSEHKASGASIRLFRPATAAEQLLPDGTACAPYQGNDLKLYRTVKIGTQVWLADNLAETKFRTGEDITEVTDNAAWAALTTGAMCAYNNDWSNV